MMPANSSAASFARVVTRAQEEYAMYEDFYGFVEKPFSLTPDPKYLYKSESHANAFELLQYGIRRREGFIVVTGDIGRPISPDSIGSIVLSIGGPTSSRAARTTSNASWASLAASIFSSRCCCASGAFHRSTSISPAMEIIAINNSAGRETARGRQ